jgi:hypothetical protein
MQIMGLESSLQQAELKVQALEKTEVHLRNKLELREKAAQVCHPWPGMYLERGWTCQRYPVSIHFTSLRCWQISTFFFTFM